MPFFNLPPQRPKVEFKIVDQDETESIETKNGSPEVDTDDLTSEQQAVRTEASVHSAIVKNLERMQTDLATLLTRWKSAVPLESELDENEDWNASDGD